MGLRKRKLLGRLSDWGAAMILKERFAKQGLAVRGQSS